MAHRTEAKQPKALTGTLEPELHAEGARPAWHDRSWKHNSCCLMLVALSTTPVAGRPLMLLARDCDRKGGQALKAADLGDNGSGKQGTLSLLPQA